MEMQIPVGLPVNPLSSCFLPPQNASAGSLCATAAHLCGLGCRVFPQRLPCLHHPRQVPRAIPCLNSLAKEFADGSIYFSVQLFPELQPGSAPAPPRAPHPRGSNQVWLARWSHIWGLTQGPGPVHWGPDPAPSLFGLCEHQTNLLAPQASVSCSAQCGGDPYQICVCVPMN